MPDYTFCPMCGERLISATRGGRLRPVCARCGFVQFKNPAVGVAVVLTDDRGRVLLGRRSPQVHQGGAWCIPCGYVEWGEDIRDAARREFLEETGLQVHVGDVYAVHSNFHNPASLTVGVWFDGRVTGGRLNAGDDLDEVGYYSLHGLPEPLAFPTDRLVLAELRRRGSLT